jgi:hypothetical protein
MDSIEAYIIQTKEGSYYLGDGRHSSWVHDIENAKLFSENNLALFKKKYGDNFHFLTVKITIV